jgi:hypothetical protein
MNGWRKLKRKVNAFTVEALARGLIYYGLAWLLALVWREKREERRALDAAPRGSTARGPGSKRGPRRGAAAYG